MILTVQYTWWYIIISINSILIRTSLFSLCLFFSKQWATFARVWYLLDGKMQPPGKLAAIASIKLQGLHKPVYHQLSEYHFRSVMSNHNFHARIECWRSLLLSTSFLPYDPLIYSYKKPTRTLKWIWFIHRKTIQTSLPEITPLYVITPAKISVAFLSLADILTGTVIKCSFLHVSLHMAMSMWIGNAWNWKNKFVFSSTNLFP